VHAGASLLYVLRVQNLGALHATGVTLADNLPRDTTFNASRSNPNCAQDGSLVTCNLGDLSVEASHYVTVTVDIPSWWEAGRLLNNSATVSADQDDWIPDNNGDTAQSTVTVSADLRLTKSATPTASTGETVEYTLSVLNRGPSLASYVQLTDILPPGVVFVSATPSADCSRTGSTVTCALDYLDVWQTATVVLTTMASAGGTQTNTASVTAAPQDPDPQNNGASASTEVEAVEPQTRTIGQVTVVAYAFVDLGGGREQAVGGIRLGAHYRLDGTSLILDFNDNTLTGEGTLILDVGDLPLFSGGFTANGNSGLLTPAAGVVYELQQVAGSDLQTAPSITQVNLLSGQAVGQATLHVHPPGLDTTLTADFTIGPGPTFGGTVQSFDFALVGCTINVTGATLSAAGITVAASTFTLPAQFGGGSTAFAGLTITPTSFYVGGGGGSFSLPDMEFGAGDHLWITDLTATLSFAFGSFIMQAAGTVMINIPGNVTSVSVDKLFLDTQGDLSGSVELLQLGMAGGRLNMMSLQVNNAGLLAPSADWWLPGNLVGGSEKVYVPDVALTGYGLDISRIVELDLPDLNIGDKASFAGMKGHLVKTDEGITLSIIGLLKLFLPQNSQAINFTAQLDTQGRFQGTLDQLTINIATISLHLTKIGFDNTNLSVAKGTLTLPASMGGITGIVTDVRIDENGLSIGGGGVGIPLPDFDMGSGAFTVTDAMLSFEVGADRTFKVSISGTIQIAVKSLNASATGSISVDSQGHVSGYIQSFSISIAGLGLAIEKAEITGDGFFAAKAALQVPGSWGGLTAEVYNVSIGPDGISIGGGRFKLPNIQAGSVTLAGLEGWFIEVEGGYEIGAGGKFVIPGLGGGAGCGISVSVTIFVDAAGQTVARIETTQPPMETLLAEELASSGNPRLTNLTPEDVAEIQGLALRNVSVALEGCSIAIGNTGLYLTRVSGSLTLYQGTTRIDLGVTISGGPKVLGVSAISGDVDLGMQFNPFQLDLTGAINLFSIFKMAEMSATIRQDLFSASLRVVQYWPPFEGTASLTIWTNDGFHLVGRATLTLGFSKGCFGEVCVPGIGWPCVDLPPFDLRLADIGAEFGEFVKDGGTVWGLKVWVTIGISALDLTVTVGVYFDASGGFHVGNVDEYHTVTPPTVAQARALWQAMQAGEVSAAALSAQERKLLETFVFTEDDIYVIVPVAAPTDLLILLSRVSERPAISLIRPDGLEITPDNTPYNVGFHEDLLTDELDDGTVRTATQVMVVVKDAEPGIWQVKLSGSLGPDDQYVLQVNGIDPAPVLRDISAVSTGPTSGEFGWSLLSNEITTTLNIYAITGPIVATHVVTDSNGVAKEVTVPLFSGAPIATAVPTLLDGTPGRVELDLSRLETGAYHIWFDANDDRNPPIRAYAPNPIEVVQSWKHTWTANLEAIPDYRQLIVQWDRSPNPDVDVYRLRVNTLPGALAAQGIQVAAQALNASPEIEVGNVLSTTLYNLTPDQPLYLTVLAVDEETGQVALSGEIGAVPEGAPFELQAATTDVTLIGGQEASVSLDVTTHLAEYPEAVGLSQGQHADGLTLLPDTDLVTPTLAGAPVQVTVQATEGVPGGDYTASLVASGGGVERTLDLHITILEPTFELSADPPAVALGQGESASVTISARGLHGEDDPVHLSLEGDSIPAWLQYDFTATTVSMDGSVTLILTDTEHLENGAYTLQLTGRDGEHTKHLDITLNVEKAGFNLTTERDRRVALHGETVTYTLQLAGFLWPDPVTLALAAAPVPGSTLGFVAEPGDPPTDRVSVTAPAQVYLVATITPDTNEGLYLLHVQASSQDKQETLALELVVQAEATSADLGVAQAHLLEAVAGTSYVYTVTVINFGPLTATEVVVTDTLPVSYTASVAATPSQGDCAAADGLLVCQLGDLARDGQTTVEVELAVHPSAPAGSLLTNVASASTAGNEVALLNNRKAGNALVSRQANLALLKSDAPDPVNAGSDLQYNLTVINYGPSDASGVTLQDTLPADVTFVSATPAQGECVEINGALTCDLGTLADETAIEVTIQVAVNSDAPGIITNRATVSGNEEDPVPENNSDAQETSVARQADLSLHKAASPDPATAGANLAYTLLTTNQGPSDAPGVTLTDILPDGVAFLSATPSDACSESGGTVTCDLGAIASGESILATVIVAVGSGAGGVLSNSAAVVSTADDPRPENDTITVDTPVATLADLSLLKADAPDPVTAGQRLTYTLLVSNHGPSDASTVTVQDILPADVTFLSATASQGNCAEAGGLVSCDLGDLASDARATVTIAVTVDPTMDTGPITNAASVTTVTADPHPSNNAAAAGTTVLAAEPEEWRAFLPLLTGNHAPPMVGQSYVPPEPTPG